MMRKLCYVMFAVLLLLFPLAGCSAQCPDLCVTVLDVGQSDCTLLTQGEHAMLVDTGTATERAAVISQLLSLGVRELDYVLISHPHEDHYGNARVLLESFSVGTLILPDTASDEIGYRILLQIAQERGVLIKTVANGWSFSLGDARCELMSSGYEGENLNNESLLLRVVYGVTSFLFMGDAEQEAETALLNRYGAAPLKCDWIKIGHHGSNTASSDALLDAVSPRMAAISCGEENDYGFPHDEVLARLQARGVEILRTDTDGALTFRSDGREIVYEGA